MSNIYQIYNFVIVELISNKKSIFKINLVYLKSIFYIYCAKLNKKI